MATWKFEIFYHRSLNLYVHAKNASGQTNNGNVYEDFDISNWSDYSKALSETDLGSTASPEINPYSLEVGSAYDTPAYVIVFERVGASAASTDPQVGVAIITQTDAVIAPTSDPYSETNLKIQLTSLQTAISNALSNPKPDWQVGQVRMSQHNYLRTLFEMQQKLIEELKKFPAENISTHQNAISPFGEDITDYSGEVDF